MVSLSDVTMRYPGSKTDILRGANVKIEDGEFVFLVGPSGAGKTTIIKLLTGEEKATGGKIRINGFDMRAIKRKELPKLRRTEGVIFQDFRLIEDMTVYENVAFAMRVIGASNRDIRKRVPYVLELVGLNNCGNRFPRELSGGEQQRVAIARALVNAPQLVIADEPTGNLDPAKSLEIMVLLKSINELEPKRTGPGENPKKTTVIVVTHEKELVNNMGKRVVALVDKELVEQTGYFNEKEKKEEDKEDGKEDKKVNEEVPE